MPQVLRAADARLSRLREHGMTDAGGLVIASDQQTARAYAKLLGRASPARRPWWSSPTTRAPPAGSPRSPLSEQRWLVAVRMVSEGVDIPRLAVGVYATSASTPLYFAQAIGRFVRARRTGETATVFLPSVPHLLGPGQRDGGRSATTCSARRRRRTGSTTTCWSGRSAPRTPSGELEKRFEALSATAELDQVIFDGASFGTGAMTGTPEEEEYLGLPGLLTADQVSVLLNKRQAEQMAAQKRQRGAPSRSRAQREPAVVALTAGERRVSLRRQLNTLVAAHHHRTNLPHGKIHAELRRLCGGPPSAQATIEQLEERIATIQTM